MCHRPIDRGALIFRIKRVEPCVFLKLIGEPAFVQLKRARRCGNALFIIIPEKISQPFFLGDLNRSVRIDTVLNRLLTNVPAKSTRIAGCFWRSRRRWLARSTCLRMTRRRRMLLR